MNKLIVSRDPEIMSGALVFDGTRVPVKTIFDYLVAGEPLEDFLEDFPTVTRAHVISVLEAAHSHLGAHEAFA